MNENAKDRAKRIAKWLWDCSNSTTSEEYDAGLLTKEFEAVEQQAREDERRLLGCEGAVAEACGSHVPDCECRACGYWRKHVRLTTDAATHAANKDAAEWCKGFAATCESLDATPEPLSNLLEGRAKAYRSAAAHFEELANG